MSSRWNVQRTEGALRDLTEIVHWTIQNFGTRQADIYSETIALAMEALESGPSAIGAKKTQRPRHWHSRIAHSP